MSECTLYALANVGGRVVVTKAKIDEAERIYKAHFGPGSSFPHDKVPKYLETTFSQPLFFACSLSLYLSIYLSIYISLSLSLYIYISAEHTCI